MTNRDAVSNPDTNRQAGGVWTVARVLDWAAEDLRARHAESPRLDAELLLAEVLNCDRIRLILDRDRPLESEELSAYRELHKRRRRGEPIAYLRGWREFYSRPFVVDRRVLVPRPETELLVETALARSRRVSLSARVLDVCTGTGCVAITIKKERPTNTVLASDISREALEVARINCERLGALVGLWQSDLFAAFASHRFDVVTANPPYIPDADMAGLPVDVREFEPHIALAAGADGLAVTRRLIQEAPAVLAPDAVLAIEVVAGSARAAADLLEERGFSDVAIERDYAGHERIVSGIWAR
jgi:release factor glutamine methyltransferase